MIQDVSAKLVGQFADNLGSMLSTPAPAGDDQPTAPREIPVPPGAEARQAPPSDESELDGLAIAASVANDRLKNPQVLISAGVIVLLIALLLRRRGAR